MFRRMPLVIALAACAAVPAIASAGVILSTPAPLVSGSGSASVFVFTGAANNDNATAPAATITVTGKNFTAPGPIDIAFTSQNSQGTTEYFVSEGVTNSTSAAWIGYTIQLGYGSGASFVASTSSDTLDFDFPDKDPTPTYSSFTTLSHGEDKIGWSGGAGVPVTGTASITFSIDVPDNLLNSGFTLRQAPILAPEPTTLLASLGLTLLGRRRRSV